MLIAGIVARSIKRRTDLLKYGMAIGVAQAALVPILIVLSGQSFADLLLPLLSAALVSGALVALLALGALPLLEQAFDMATELRLLEMAAGDNPILNELAMTSPGTYHHSVMVANLAESAALAIGASGFEMPGHGALSRYRKDQATETISTKTSAPVKTCMIGCRRTRRLKVIFDHVRDGLQMARQQGLGSTVLLGIAQHHGTGLLRGFYQKALHGPEGNTVKEEDFRYPGQKPQSREAGVLMLADSTEAATRALKDPSPADVRRRVNEVLEAQILDGQLEDCDLTMKDLAAVEVAFTRILTLGVYHNRIEYPKLPSAEQRKLQNENSSTGHRGVGFLRRLGD